MAQNVNDSLYDRTIDHVAMTRLFEENVQTDTKRIIRRHRNRLLRLLKSGTIDRLTFRTQVQPEVKRFTAEMNSALGNSMKDYALTEVDFTTNNLAKSIGKYANVRRPGATKVLESVVGVNVRGDGNLAQRIQGLGTGQLTRMKTAIDSGLAQGLTNAQIIQNVIGKTRLTEAQASALVRTAITRTQSVSQLSVLRDNPEIMKGVRFTAVLDSRTSAICAHHDGKVYDLDDNRFTPPLHWRCRSTLVPVVKSHSELLESTSPDVKKSILKKLDGKGITRLNGLAPAKETYGKWLKRQSRDVKIRHFQGDLQKVDLFDNGQLPVESFTTASGKPLSLTALRRLDNKNTNTTPVRQKVLSSKVISSLVISASRPTSLIRSSDAEEQLRLFFRAEASNTNSLLALTDYRGTSIPGMKATRRRANNQFDERNQGTDPMTGETKSTLVYDPDFKVLQERIDYLDQSKILSKDQKEFIKNFVLKLEKDGVSVNQQSAIIENLRVVFERFAKDKLPWENLAGVLRAELKNSVINTSRILDRRSRSRSKLFKFGNAGEAQVQIMGEWITASELANRTLKNQRYIRDWAVTDGLKVARKTYLQGRSPLRNYFPKLPDVLPKVPNAKANIIKEIESLPFGKAFIRKWEGKPSDSAITKFLQAGNERKRRFLDLDFAYTRKREDYLQKLATPEFLKDRIQTMSTIMKDIATGNSTDYDSLAIQIGKRLHESEVADVEVFFKAPTIAEYHKIGSNILTGLKEQGKIKIGLRGVTRRGVVDLDSGRSGIGSFKDTISREVQIIDPDMLKLQRANRELIISRRFGIVNEKDRLFVKAGEKKFFDARGNKTDISVVTRKASGNYDKDLVDRDFANMLNHVMEAEWEIDQDFGSFMDALAHFRDPRGQVAKYDELNSFRKVLLQRGEMGSGMMQAIQWHLARGKSWRNWAQIDGRGRVYTQGYLHPAGGEFVRPFLNTAKAVNIDEVILNELRIQLGTLVGEAFSVLTNQGRLASFRANEKAFREIGELLLSTTQRDRRIREFLEHPLIVATEAEEIPKLARFALEYTRIHNHVGGDFTNIAKLKTYKTKLGNENDASASGAQLIALTTRDRALAEASNVLATNRKNRLYDLVAERTMSDPAFRRINPIGNDISFGDLAKGAKGQSMVAFYGAGQATQAGAIEMKLAKALAKQNYTVISSSDLRDFNKSLDLSIKKAEADGLKATVLSLKELKREINYSINNNAPIGNRLLAMAQDMHPDSEDFVRKLTNVKGGLIGPQQFRQVAEIMSGHLKDIAPVTEKFVAFWKDVARVYITESKQVDLPWVTMDGKLLFQRYRPVVQERIEFRDPVTGRKVSNIYEDTITDSKFIGNQSIIGARSGLGVNGNHMNDATIVRQFHLWGRKNRILTSTIHDGFYTNIADSIKAKFKLREIYGDAIESDSLLNTLKEMRKRGLTDESYKRLVQKAIDDGLLNPANGVTRKDILAEIPEGWDWYGIGP
jgi:SPP1 gp7 family putative phage head morphogenesis protein